LFSTTCAAKRDYASKVSQIKMKVGAKASFYMGFNIFNSNNDTSPEWAGVGRNLIRLTLTDSATTLAAGIAASAMATYLF